MLYRLVGENIKIHVMTDEKVLLDVLENLTERFENQEFFVSLDRKKNDFFWDPGSGLRFDPNEIKFSFKLSDGFCIHVRSQHWFSFLNCVRENLIDTSRSESVYGGLFFKIHGELHIACLSKQQKDELVKQIAEKTEEYGDIAKEQWAHLKSFDDEAWYDEYLLRQEGKIVSLR